MKRIEKNERKLFTKKSIETKELIEDFKALIIGLQEFNLSKKISKNERLSLMKTSIEVIKLVKKIRSHLTSLELMASTKAEKQVLKDIEKDEYLKEIKNDFFIFDFYKNISSKIL